MKSLEERLNNIGACKEAVVWARGKTFEEAWTTCPRGDWMLWLCATEKLCDLRTLTLMKGECAALAKSYMQHQESIDAVDAAIAFGRGEITLRQLHAAADAAAAFSAADAAAAYAAYAADAADDAAAADDADAAYAAAAADAAAYAAARAAARAAYAAYAARAAFARAAFARAAAADEYENILIKCAEICRRILPNPKF